ncbi:unnamed protein product [Rhizoctonia solani]|uniref:NAD(P)-binding domain-containing protein n=1 Tax=Rhizoctonia solani TaxID=456999 RepID=A0A8H3BR56_9AGAM|nr:unnamed protein product [Rhizoctonia solani]
MTRILVLGGTGDMGIILIRKALDAGHIVTVYARNPSKLPEDIACHESIIITKGELTDEDSLRHAIRNTHAVLSNLGPGTTPSHFPGAHPSDLPLAKAYSLILRIMKEPDVECKRIILLGTVSIPDPNDKRDMAIWTLVQGVKWTAYDAYADEVAIGETVRREGDGIEWTIVRVPLLTKSENEAVVAGYVGGSKMGTDSLASSSLVCKDWRLAALPLLYESIRLISVPKTHPIEASSGLSCSENHPEELVNEVIREVNNDEQTFRFSNSARRLVVVWKMNELQLQTFSSAVLKMKNLEHLTWVVSVLGSVNWHNTLALLCKMLTKLCSVRLSLPVGDLGFSNQVMGALINLKELSIGFDEQGEDTHF